MRIHWQLGITALLIGAIGATAATQQSAHVLKTSSAATSQQIAAGKALISKDHCNSCHGADLKGKPKFSPSLYWTSLSKEYNAKSFATVMDTGVTPDGGKVKQPMPVYHLKAAESASLVAYLKTLK